MKKQLVGLIFLVYVFSVDLNSQNIEYAREVIDTLTSSYFSGRGAVNKGEKKAADYIANEFLKVGLKPIAQSFFQPFNYSINTFPSTLKVKLEDKELIAGVDYLVDPKSVKTKGVFNLVYYDKSTIPSKKKLYKLKKQGFFKDKIIVIDDKDATQKEEFTIIKTNGILASGLVFLEEAKLTHHLSTIVSDYVVLKVLRNSFDKTATKISIEIDQEFIPNYTSQNVIGKIVGAEFPDSIIVFSAHYDHLGKMGSEVYFPGANDNASGIAMLLNLAYYYSYKEVPKKTIVFMAFGAEEAGIIGSKHFVENPTFSLASINFMINVDIMGTGDEGIQVVNGSEFKPQFDKLVEINSTNNYLKQVKIRGKAANSDHYWFAEKGVPAIFIYTLGGIKAYHDVYDVSKTLPLSKFEDCFRLLTDFVNEL
ncbi:M28 family metallopeptidase [Vicingus serpentipes]|uniref:M28 family metallopeptidase n=1 Tax=Vicingus serpentipes TaxID=1926625 RepID=UPI001476B883|nr:M28 family peptidase [Vicingus serpentipes]